MYLRGPEPLPPYLSVMTALGLGSCLSLALALLLASPAPSAVSASFLVSWFSSAEGQQGNGDCYRQCRQVAVPLLGEILRPDT